MRCLVSACVLLVAACATPGPRLPDIPPGAPFYPAEGTTAGDIHFKAQGPRIPGEAPLLLLHGNFDSLDGWDAIAGALPIRVPAVRVDLPGYGASGSASPASFQEVARRLVEALDELGIDRVVLVGHSLGGILAARIAELHPDRVAHVVLVSPGYIGSPEAMRLAGAAVGLAAQGQGHQYREAVRAALLSAVHRDEVATDVAVAEYSDRLLMCLGAVMERVGSLWGYGRTPAQLPLTVVVGAHDAWVPASEADAFLDAGVSEAGYAPRRAFVLADSGHLGLLEQPADLARILAAAAGDGSMDALPRCPGTSPVDPATWLDDFATERLRVLLPTCEAAR